MIQRNHYCTVTEPSKKRSAALARSLRGAWIFVELVLIKSSRETLAVKSFSADHTGKLAEENKFLLLFARKFFNRHFCFGCIETGTVSKSRLKDDNRKTLSKHSNLLTSGKNRKKIFILMRFSSLHHLIKLYDDIIIFHCRHRTRICY